MPGYYDAQGNWVETSAPAPGSLEAQYKAEIDLTSPKEPRPGMRDQADLGAAAMIDRDRASWEAQLKEQAAQAGVPYDPSDLQDVMRNVSYARNAGLDPAVFIGQHAQTYRERAAQRAAGGGGQGQGGSSAASTADYPYPERVEMPEPTAPTPYSSTYQQQFAQQFQGVGEADRNRLMQAILQSPETMGATQQAQLFEQQKELLNAQRAQQQAQLSQNLLQRGLSSGGGTFQATQGDLNQQFNTQLLQAQRDIAIRAAQQNRQDQLAALQMQEAMASGDYQKMMGIYQANQQERANTENFLRQAQEVTQQGQLQYNAQRLAQAVAQQNEILDFYRFLEAQRQNVNQYGLDYARLLLGGVGA
jgi:hypothetical protein